MPTCRSLISIPRGTGNLFLPLGLLPLAKKIDVAIGAGSLPAGGLYRTYCSRLAPLDG